MANTITNLIPDAYAALDVVSRELVGMIPAMQRDATVERAAIGQTVRSPVVASSVAIDLVPAVIPPDTGDQTIGNVPITITKAKGVYFRWNGEQERGLRNGGPGTLTIQQNQVAQAMRTLVNLIEADCANLVVQASRATGVAGTTPFASTLNDPAQAEKILDDNGAPQSGRTMVLNTTAVAAMSGLTQLTNVNQSGDANFLRQGVMSDLFGFNFRKSAQIPRPVIGTSSNTGTTNTAGYAVGSTVITVAAAGTGTILAGDIVTFTGDTNKYVVSPGGGVASLAAGGTLTIQAPGLQQALPASAVTITVAAQSYRNFFFTRNALILAQRMYSMPDGGDLATDSAIITDDRSGLSFELRMYPQFKQMQYEISCAWGVAMIKPEHTGVLLG